MNRPPSLSGAQRHCRKMHSPNLFQPTAYGCG